MAVVLVGVVVGIVLGVVRARARRRRASGPVGEWSDGLPSRLRDPESGEYL